MYFRHSKSEQKIPTSRTPLNSFLFNKLYQLKSSADHRGLKNQSFCYAKIIKSLTKYPLPLFSISQAIELEGVGDKTALIIFKILKKHYEQYIKTGNALYPSSQMINADSNSFFSQGGLEEIKIDLNQDFEASNEIITGPELFEEFKVSLNKRSHEDVFDNVKDLEHLKKKLLIEKDSTKPTSKYKLPDPGSVPASVLMSLLAFQSRQSGKYSSKKEIKKVSEEMTVKCAEINNWNCIKTLLKHDIIYNFEFDGIEKYCLSQEGEKMAEKLLEYHLKLIERNNFNPITNFDNYSFVTQEKTLNSVPILSQNTQILKPIIERNTSEEKTGQKNKDKLKEDKEFVIPIETIEGFNVVLIVDNREVKAQDDRSYIHQKLIENGLNCEMGTLPLGDFLWIARIKEKNNDEIKLFLLDYIIERKTADDLASSIIDGRYQSQRSRLKRSQISKVFWLIEGEPSQNSNLPAHVLETSEFHLQFAYNFNLKKTVNLQETLKWLSQMTLAIQRKLKIQMKQNKPLKFRMSLEDFISNNKKSSNNIGDIFQNMLGNVKECGKQACNSIFEKYKTPLVFFKALTNIETESEKLEMLSLKARKANKNLQNEKNDDINLRITLAKRLVVLFCEENYPDFVNYSDKEDVDGLF